MWWKNPETMERIWGIHVRCMIAEERMERRRLEYRRKQKARLLALIILMIWGLLWIM